MDKYAFFSKINSWGDFSYALTQLNNKEKGDTFELITKLYFKLNPLYDEYDEVWLWKDVPTKELEALDLPSIDLGIDLLAKIDDEYHPIQCKYHSDKHQAITYKEVSTFLTLFESNDKFTQGYICSSADLTSRNYQKVKTKPISLIMSDCWQALDKEFFDRVRAYLHNRKIELEPFEPREHQRKAIKDAVKYFVEEGNLRGKLIFPCGAGKSLTGYWLTEALWSKKTVIAVPSLALVKQTLEVYLRETVAHKKHVKWLCICSDEGIGKSKDVVVHTEEIGVPCNTDQDYIKQWLIKHQDEELIIFTTYQSGRLIAEVSKDLDFTFDVGIFDEAHKTVGSNKKLFSHLLFEENIAIDKRIFMTATERFYQGSKDDIISMDDHEIYGDVFTQMTFKEAIKMDPPLLSDYRVITIEITQSEIGRFIQENKLVQLNDKWGKETEARSLASMLALRKAMARYPIHNAVSFHSSIEKAKRNKDLQTYITDTFHYQVIDTYTVSGKIPTAKRNDIVQEFASSDHSLITNARCLTEGVDVPNIDCIVFVDPRKSQVDIVQALGRALRKKEGKEWGYVILPVLVDEETGEIDNKSYDEIWAVVKSLASNDERIIDYFKDKGEKKGGTRDVEQFQFDVLAEDIDDGQLAEELEIRLWKRLGKLNWRSFGEAREFVHSLKLKGSIDWGAYCKSGEKPADIPTSPDTIYGNQHWKGWGDWIGTGNIKRKQWRTFEEAREFVRSLGLKNGEWEVYYKSNEKPDDIPTGPQRVYRNLGWKDMNDWLGTEDEPNKFAGWRSFKEARKFVRALGLKKTSEWLEYCKSGQKPVDIPTGVRFVYMDQGFKGMPDFLGTQNKRRYQWCSFHKAKEFAQSLGLKSSTEWKRFIRSGKKPLDIPSNADKAYKDKGWKGWEDFLGNE